MEQNNKILFLFQTSFSLWILSFALMVLFWAWTLLLHNETSRGKGPSLNLKGL
jgi:hypothetical protein